VQGRDTRGNLQVHAVARGDGRLAHRAHLHLGGAVVAKHVPAGCEKTRQWEHDLGKWIGKTRRQCTYQQFSAVSLGCVMQTLHAAASSALLAAAARDSARVSSSLARAAPCSESATTWL
jgi:hypothetical protein